MSDGYTYTTHQPPAASEQTRISVSFYLDEDAWIVVPGPGRQPAPDHRARRRVGPHRPARGDASPPRTCASPASWPTRPPSMRPRSSGCSGTQQAGGAGTARRDQHRVGRQELAFLPPPVSPLTAWQRKEV